MKLLLASPAPKNHPKGTFVEGSRENFLNPSFEFFKQMTPPLDCKAPTIDSVTGSGRHHGIHISHINNKVGFEQRLEVEGLMNEGLCQNERQVDWNILPSLGENYKIVYIILPILVIYGL